MGKNLKNDPIRKYGAEAPKEIDRLFYNIVLDDEQLAFANAIWNPENLIVFLYLPQKSLCNY